MGRMVRCMGCMTPFDGDYQVCPHCGYVIGTRPKEAYHLVPGTQLHRKYTVGRVIGYGGFGVTYIGYDDLMQRKVAIKEYLPGEFSTRAAGTAAVTVFSGDKEEQFISGVTKFSEEAKRLAKMEHVPGVVKIYDTFTENNTSYIIMEYLDGENLKQRLEREGKIEPEEAVQIMIPILQALTEVHAVGMLHRDISPDNIFLTSSGEVKLLDFGAARFATTTHSRSLSVVVKQGFAPEEQYRSRGDQGTWTDVYACGATLYKMITGITPEDAMERREKDELVPPSKLGIKIDKNLETAIMNAMNIRIQDRTQTAEQFVQELTTETKVKRLKNRLKGPDIGRWPKWLKMTAASAAAVVLTLAVLIFTGVIDNPFRPKSSTLADDEVYMPAVTNVTLERAQQILEENHLTFQIIDKKNSDEIPADLVLSQSTQMGQVVKKGSMLNLIISAGKERLFIEDMTGRSREEAEKALKALGFTIEIKEENSDSVAPGYLTRLEYSDGQNLEDGIEKGSKVILWISKGKEGIDKNRAATIPNVVGMSWKKAEKSATKANVYLKQAGTEYSKTVPKGAVISQDPPGGTKGHEGDTVSVVISLGNEMVRVPDLQYKSRSEAERLLKAVGLKISVTYEDNENVAKDKVIRQNIAAFSEVEPGTVISVAISNGPKNAPVVPTDDTEAETEKEQTTQKKAQKDTTRKRDKTTEREKPKTTEDKKPKKTEQATERKTEAPDPEIPSYTLKFDANGGTVSESSRTVQSGKKIGNLPTPTRDYYSFQGWYYGSGGTGTKAASTDEMKSSDTTLYASWQQNPVSGWVMASEAPADAEIVDEKWTYTMRETKTSKNSSEAGWTQYNKRTSYGSWSGWTRTYAAASDTLDVETKTEREESVAHYKNHRHFNKKSERVYYKDKSGGYLNSGTFTRDEWYSKPEVAGGAWSAGRWAGWNGESFAGRNHDGMICFLDYWDYADVTYYRTRSINTTYYYERYVDKTSYTEVTASGTISNVTKWVRYREK